MRNLEAWGFGAEDFAGETVFVWPENRSAVIVFNAMRTQWRAAMGGYTGLDYGVLPEVWRRLKVPPADRDAVFADLQVLEDAALNEMRKAKD